MTDREIVKALECRVKDKCPECPYFHGYPCDKCRNMQTDALDLINRLQAKVGDKEDTIQYADKVIKQLEKCKDTLICEKLKFLQQIESLQAENEILQAKIDGVQEANAILRNNNEIAINNAIKEFAERLCEDRVSNDPVVIAVKVELKELVGEDNESKN